MLAAEGLQEPLGEEPRAALCWTQLVPDSSRGSTADTAQPRCCHLWLGETWPRGRCPCSWQGGWNQMTWKVPSKPNYLQILREAVYWPYPPIPPCTERADESGVLEKGSIGNGTGKVLFYCFIWFFTTQTLNWQYIHSLQGGFVLPMTVISTVPVFTMMHEPSHPIFYSCCVEKGEWVSGWVGDWWEF